MNREFRVIVALSLSIVLCAGLLVACAEKAPHEDTTSGSTNAPIETTVGNGSTVEQTVAGSVPGTANDPRAEDTEEVSGATQSSLSGGNNEGSDIGNDSDTDGETGQSAATTQATNSDSNNSGTNTGKPSVNDGAGQSTETTQGSTKPTTAPTTSGNSTEIVVPLTPVTTAPLSQATTETPVQEPTSGSSTPDGDDQATDSTTAPSEPIGGGSGTVSGITYEEYMNMSGEDQMAYFESFASVEDYFAWYNGAKSEYDKQNPPIEIEDGSIDLGELMGGNG